LIGKLGGNNKQVVRCLEIFKTDTHKLLEAIETSLKNKDEQGSKNSFHSLRGMLLTMEMRKAASTVAAMEVFVEKENFENSQNLFSALTNEIEFAVDYIERSMQADAW
jgi:HPt (histidine-containing phosphotransfer) domain-containing protein